MCSLTQALFKPLEMTPKESCFIIQIQNALIGQTGDAYIMYSFLKLGV